LFPFVFTENVSEENLFYIVSPKDLVLAKPRNIDDHIKWLTDHGKYEVCTKMDLAPLAWSAVRKLH